MVFLLLVTCGSPTPHSSQPGIFRWAILEDLQIQCGNCGVKFSKGFCKKLVPKLPLGFFCESFANHQNFGIIAVGHSLIWLSRHKWYVCIAWDKLVYVVVFSTNVMSHMRSCVSIRLRATWPRRTKTTSPVSSACGMKQSPAMQVTSEFG